MHHVGQENLPFVGSSHELVGAEQGDTSVSVFLFHGKPGSGPGPHRHPYLLFPRSPLATRHFLYAVDRQRQDLRGPRGRYLCASPASRRGGACPALLGFHCRILQGRSTAAAFGVRRLDAAFPQRKTAELVLRRLQPNFDFRLSLPYPKMSFTLSKIEELRSAGLLSTLIV
jgi:hypothetical protein